MSLKTTIELIDKVSSGFDSASASGVEAMSKIEESLSSANEAYSQYSDGASNAVKSTSQWTSAADMYNKSAMEAVYTTEISIHISHKGDDSKNAQKTIKYLPTFKNYNKNLFLLHLNQLYICANFAIFHLFIGAKPYVFSCQHIVRTNISTLLQHLNSNQHHNVRPLFYNFFQDNRF